MASSNIMYESMKARNNKDYVLLNNLGSKHGLVMKLASLCNLTKVGVIKQIFLPENSVKEVAWKLVAGTFAFL